MNALALFLFLLFCAIGCYLMALVVRQEDTETPFWLFFHSTSVLLGTISVILFMAALATIFYALGATTL